MPRQPCIECHRRPPHGARRRCLTCLLRNAPIGEQVAAARVRLAMVPPELRRKRTPKLQALAPAGTAWCAGCQSWRDVEDFRKGATACRPCASGKAHAAMIERTYGLTSDGYDELLALQGGRCAICRNRPGKKRFAVDHDHATGAVRGLLCSTDNHDLLGAGYDSPAKLLAAWHYLNTPPASGQWVAPELGLAKPGDGVSSSDAQRPSKPSLVSTGLMVTAGKKPPARPALVPGGHFPAAVLPAEYETAPLPDLWATYSALHALLLRRDPPPF